MPLIEWDEEKFGLNIRQIDDHHKRWIDLINSLHEQLVGSAKESTKTDIISEMLEYCEFHFSAEEELMCKADYPAYKDHKMAHDVFRYRLKEVERDLRSGDSVLRTQILSLMKNWLEDHITKVDKQFGDFMQEKGGL